MEKIEKQGKIITNFGGRIVVKLNDTTKVDCTMRNHLKSELTVGDNVNIEFLENSTPVITKLFPRTNLIERPALHKRKNKYIAANIDLGVIIITHKPAPIEHYIDRYLAAFHKANITPIIIANKSDLQKEKDKKIIDNLLSIYSNIGYKTLTISAKNNINIDILVKEILNGKTSIFIGQSGVGKSETLNTIIGKKITNTQNISKSNNRGKHTTTCSTLYEIDDNTSIIDSPGIREFGLWHLTQEELFDGFAEFKKLKGMCKFRNCEHKDNSLGCEIYKNVANESINKDRFLNYHRILKEILEK